MTEEILRGLREPEAEKRTETVQYKVTSRQKETLVKLAQQRGMSLSALIRTLIVEAVMSNEALKNVDDAEDER